MVCPAIVPITNITVQCTAISHPVVHAHIHHHDNLICKYNINNSDNDIVYQGDRIQFNVMNTVLCMQTMCYKLYDINSQNISDFRIAPVRAHPLALLRWRVPPITVGPHPGSQYLAPALALGSPVLAPQGHPTSGYLVKSPLTISFASVRVRSCELRRYNHPRHTLTTN